MNMRMARRNTKSTVHSYCAKVSMFSCKKQAPQPDSGFAQSTPRVPLSLTSILISLSLPTCTYTLKRNRRDKTAHHQPSWDPTKKAKPWPLQNTQSNGEDPTHEWFRSYEALEPFFKENLFATKPPQDPQPRIVHLGTGDSV
jgi:hypothetical protein